jgi:hypothetical protein
MVASSVSPERCDITQVMRLRCAMFTAASVSDRVPIWLTFTSSELAQPFSIPSARRAGLVTNRSSPTSCTRSPSASVSIFQPSQSSSEQPSSIDRIG